MKIYKSPAIHRTPLYRARSAYVSMGHRALNKTGKNPAYADVELHMTLEEWLVWAIPEYERFEREHPDESSNVSRKGDKGHYEIGNIRIATKAENLAEYATHSPARIKENGLKRCTECKKDKPLSMYNKSKATPTGHAYHCKDCMRKFHENYESKRKEVRNGPPVYNKPIQHGTVAGFSMERARNVPHCEECIQANKDYTKQYREKLKLKYGVVPESG